MNRLEAVALFKNQTNLKFLGTMSLVYIWQYYPQFRSKPLHVEVAANLDFLDPSSSPEEPKLKPGFFAGCTMENDDDFVLTTSSFNFPENYPSEDEFAQMLEAEIRKWGR